MGFYKQFILDLQKRIKSYAPEWRFIDQNLGQWGNDTFNTSVAFPGILIDFPSTNYSDINSGSQLALTNIKLTLFWSTHSQSSSLAPAGVKDKALEYYEQENKLMALLQNWSEDYFTPLTRTNATSRNQNELGLRIREIDFTTEHEEYLEDCNIKEVAELTFNFNGQIQQTDPTD